MGIGLKSFASGLMNMIQQERDLVRQKAEEERKMATQLAYQKALMGLETPITIAAEKRKHDYAKELEKLRSANVIAETEAKEAAELKSFQTMYPQTGDEAPEVYEEGGMYFIMEPTKYGKKPRQLNVKDPADIAKINAYIAWMNRRRPGGGGGGGGGYTPLPMPVPIGSTDPRFPTIDLQVGTDKSGKPVVIQVNNPAAVSAPEKGAVTEGDAMKEYNSRRAAVIRNNPGDANIDKLVEAEVLKMPRQLLKYFPDLYQKRFGKFKAKPKSAPIAPPPTGKIRVRVGKEEYYAPDNAETRAYLKAHGGKIVK